MSAPMRPLDWRTLPLEGRALIEASAGTGKTWSIAQLYLRLLLERGLGVEQILVCTFTEAAAQELRQRLRERLGEAERRLQQRLVEAGSGEAGVDPRFGPGRADSPLLRAANDSPDDVLDDWLDQLAGDAATRRKLAARLRAARLDFDRAPVLTLHGFCHRALRDHPFDSGAGFGRTELVDGRSLLAEAFDDFRRRALQAPPEARPPYTALLAQSPQDLLRALERLSQHPEAPRLGPPAQRLAELEARIAWLENADTLQRLRALHADADGRIAWTARSAFRTRLGVVIETLESGRGATAIARDALNALTPEKFVSGTGKARSGIDAGHPDLAALLAAAEALRAHPQVLRAALLTDAWSACRETVARRCRERGLRTYDALVGDLLQAIEGPGGEALGAALHASHPCALVDECQDTDPRQYRILDAIYAGRGSLLLIGDPKQAIYGFRGGDIAAYLQAARGVGDRRWSMAVNQRSSTRLVAALNALYGEHPDPFGHERIGYIEVGAAGRCDARPYTDADGPLARPLTLHLDLAPDSEESAIEGKLAEHEQAALHACANAVAALLGRPDHRIEGRPLRPSDIAVLLNTNQQIEQLRIALARRGVPVVGPGRSSVMASDTAEALLVVLHAVLHAGDEGALRAALATTLLGFDARRLRRLDADAARRDREAQRFEAWRQLWFERGALALVAAIEAEVAARIMAEAEGERRLTDLRHLGELLGAGDGTDTGPVAQLDQLRRARAEALERDAGSPDDSRQLRLESEGERVRLLTVFSAKGLQFNVVFVPLAWRTRKASGATSAPVVYHDDHERIVYDLGSDQFDAAAAREAAEQAAERKRLLYVALTRAVHACHVFWTPEGTPDNPLDDLLAGPGGPGTLASRLLALPGRIDSIAVERGWPMRRVELADAVVAALPRSAREDRPAPRPPWRIHSFTGLTHRAAGARFAAGLADDEPALELPGLELAGFEAEQAAEATAHPRLEALAGIRGARFGNAVHEVFELAGSQPVREQPELVVRALRGNGLPFEARDTARIAAIAEMIDRCRAEPLVADLRLDRLAPADQVAEFEFHFALGGGRLAALREAAAAHDWPDLLPPGLEGQHLHGLMNGKIDLVFAAGGRFHVLDYKSNWLGDRLVDYAPEALARAMAAAHYPLQALLYTVAVHRYLHQRLPGYQPELHLGEAIYLFVRAVGLDAGSGIWRARFTPSLVRDVDAVLAGEPAGHAA